MRDAPSGRLIDRIVIDDVHPRTPNGFPAKAVVGESVRVTADIFKDGHDTLAARVRWRAGSGNGRQAKWRTAALREGVNDRWEGVVEPTTLGVHSFVVEAWTDRYATWRHKVTAKLAAGQTVEVEMEEAAQLAEQAAGRADGADRERLAAMVASLRASDRTDVDRLEPALDPEAAGLFAAHAGADSAPDLTSSVAFPLWVDRERALVGAWYELFPRSVGGLAGTADLVPELAAMGFDVLYLPPVHPIGRSFRKGPNNTLEAGPDDPGSPWAIGGPEGGHTAIHPDLGTFEDFDRLVRVAADNGMEIALDYALQCSPDHPWVHEHPEWFHHRPDGSIAYAENPPKKYQDIYPINFWPERDEDRVALWEACRDILLFWIAKGVQTFRVDNPHTKPMAFWAWLIPAVQADHPDAIFLAEAFTRPKVMAKLAEVGFSQSYTYFTWRVAGWELREYLEELAQGPAADYMRPNFWPNTPDILSGPLRNGPRSAFALRLVLAATMVPSYGVYSGYELMENQPASEANEEYLNSEKYEIKRRERDAPGSLVPLMTQLNAIRRRHPALQRLRNIRFQGSANPAILAYAKTTEDRGDVVLVVVNLDPWNTQETTLDLYLAELGLSWDRPYEAFDELSGQSFPWVGPHPYVRLDPAAMPGHVLHLRAGA